MSTFREIDERLTSLVHPETGELLDVEAFEELAMEREAKAENMALWILQLRDDAVQIENEIRRLKARQDATERKADSLTAYLTQVLGGQKFRTPLVTVGYRTSQSVNVTDQDALIRWAQDAGKDYEVLRYRQPEISKKTVKELLDAGIPVAGAEIVSKTSTQIR